MSSARIERFAAHQQAVVRSLVLAGLAERWGSIDDALNHDLDDIATSYAHGCVLVATRDRSIVGTGTVVPRDNGTAEIVRMSVATSERRTGVGRMIVDSLVDVARSWSVQRVVCETTSQWTSAIDFYVGCGFVIDREEYGEFGRDTYLSLSLI